MIKKIIINLILICIIILFGIIVLKKIIHFDMQGGSSEESLWDNRKPAPYFTFMNRNKLTETSYDKMIYWSNENNDEKIIKVALFGGSTGEPLSEEYFSKKLSEYLHKPVDLVNFSCSSANHRQHLHMILEILPKYHPDIVVFYGGYNETGQYIYYDPRPGYPFNFFYIEESFGLRKFLIEHSKFLGNIFLRLNFIDSLDKLRDEYKPLSEEWSNKIVDKYFETMELSKKVTEIMESDLYNHTKFFGFYQPWQVDFQGFEEWKPYNEKLRQRLKKVDYLYDIHDEYDKFPKNIWNDVCHIHHESGANEHIIDVMSKIIADNINNKSTQIK